MHVDVVYKYEAWRGQAVYTRFMPPTTDIRHAHALNEVAPSSSEHEVSQPSTLTPVMRSTELHKSGK